MPGFYTFSGQSWATLNTIGTPVIDYETMRLAVVDVLSPVIPAKMPDNTLKIYEDHVGGYDSGLGILGKAILAILALAVVIVVLIIALT